MSLIDKLGIWADKIDWRWVWGPLIVLGIIANGMCVTAEWNAASEEEREYAEDFQCAQPC